MTRSNSQLFILVFLGILTAFGPFVTDMYLPTLPAMTDYFHTTSSQVQLGLTASMIGLAVGQLFFGPLSDKYGRRLPLIVAMCLFLLATLGCLYSRTIWHGIFWVLFGLGILLLLGSLHFAESLPTVRRQNARWADVYKSFLTVIHNRRYVCYILQFGFAQGVLFANIASSPFIMQEHYGFSPLMFSICFGANAIAIVISATSAVRFAHPEQALYRGSVGMVIASFLLCVALCAGCSFWIYEVLLLALLSMLGLTFTASNTLAMDSERANAGMASALLGALGFAFGGVVSPLVGLGNIMVSTGMLFFIGSVCAFVCTRIALRRAFSLAQYYRK